jgi:hypothetical protein
LSALDFLSIERVGEFFEKLDVPDPHNNGFQIPDCSLLNDLYIHVNDANLSFS